MTDYEFVKKIADGNGCYSRICPQCPICETGVVCTEPKNKAKAWLENYNKEQKMDGIKVTVEERKAEKKSEYPCLKSFKGEIKDVVLFTALRSGTVVSTDYEWNPLGFHCDDWSPDRFEPFHGKITIEVE